MNKNLTVAICGTRGVPASYGGFETFAEELGARLVEKGYRVIVYGRYYTGDKIINEDVYKGMELRNIKAIRHKYLETPVHTFFSFCQLYKEKVDIVLLCNAANSIFAWMPKVKNIPVVINLDGIERSRRKWNALGRLWYLIGEYCSALFGSSLISDANYIRRYYLDKYSTPSSVIRYGAKIMDEVSAGYKSRNKYDFLTSEEVSFLGGFNLSPGNYLLYVSRLEPENNADKVIEAYNLLSSDLQFKYPLVIVGDAPYSEKFKAHLKQIASPNVIFTGYQFGDSYKILQKGATLYFQATEVGGTHPALVEAMGFANAIIANDVPEHREVVEGVAQFYPKNDVVAMSKVIGDLLENEATLLNLRTAAYKTAVNEYSWDSICDQYEELFCSVL